MAALQIIALDTATPQLRAPASGDTYTAPRAVALAPETLTGSSAVSSLGITQTWNTTGTPTALDLNVTDTASNAASRLLDLRVGGTSRFSVSKAGGAAITNPTEQVKLTLGTGAYPKIQTTSVAQLVLTDGTNDYFHLDSAPANLRLRSGWAYAWSSSSTSSGGAADLILARDAANTLALRNGVNAQTSRVYGTFTDASNHRRLVLTMSAAGVAEVKPEGAGTGASGNVLHISGLPTSNPGPGILWNDGGTPAIGT
jgi:hypothetical protein